MAKGEFTKEEAAATEQAFEEVFEAIPRSKRGAFLGHANDVFLFLHAAKIAAPAEAETKAKQG